ncbi:ribonuclease HII [Peribacillus kribbensis]|uniref:ribonuclease HII n=1 Tax=Peribacillus kribbensis TaxID=356658 RepID=UPI00040AF226|nr:ribonuclease HII [Peribacillus kribbensis]
MKVESLSISKAAEELRKVTDLKDVLLKDCLNDRRKGVVQLAQKKRKELEKLEAVKRKFTEMSVHENRVKSQGFSLIAGIDEVGRGPLAGPVVAAAVILPPSFFLPGLNDSKQIPKSRLESFYHHIQREALAIGVGIIHSDEIDRINIYEAAKKAMNQSILELKTAPDYLLIDAMKLSAPFPQESIIKGDASSISIAAASIIAKVTRDEMMAEFGEKHPHYNFKTNAGYGTKEHLEAIRIHGITEWHRKSFAPVKDYWISQK